MDALKWEMEFDDLIWLGFIRTVSLKDIVSGLFHRMEQTDGKAKEDVMDVYEEYVELTRQLLLHQRGRRILRL